MLDPVGMSRLHRAVMNGSAALRVPWCEDSPAYTDVLEGTLTLTDSAEWEGSSVRTKLRYLAGMFPDVPVAGLPLAVATLLGVEGDAALLGRIRLVLSGFSISDPSRRTREPEVWRFQAAGGALIRGDGLMTAVSVSGLAKGTVVSMDSYLGLRDKREQDLIAAAVLAIDDGVSVRGFAARVGLPKSTAHRVMGRARVVTEELGGAA
jgi:hypothetical protein